MNKTHAALASPRPRPPARIDVRCGSKPGSFDVATHLVTCKCSACRSSSRNDPYTPPEFEAHAGKSSSKKWKVTIKILMSNSNSNSTLGDWLDEHRIEARTFSGKVAKRPSSPPPPVPQGAPPQHLPPPVPQHLPPHHLPQHLAAAAYYHAQAQAAAAARGASPPRPSPHTPARQLLVPPTSAPPPPRKDKERAADGRPPTRRRLDVSQPSSSQPQAPTLSPRAEQINAALRAGNSPKVTGWRLTDTDRLSVSMEIGPVTFSGTIDESPRLLASAVEVEQLEHVPLPTEAVVFVAGNERMVIPHTFFGENEIAWAMYRLGRHSTWMRLYSTWLLKQRDNV